MNTTYIRNSASKVIGFIKSDGYGKQFAYAGARLVGIYKPELDKTFDSQLRVYGNGNQLAALVRCADDD